MAFDEQQQLNTVMEAILWNYPKYIETTEGEFIRIEAAFSKLLRLDHDRIRFYDTQEENFLDADKQVLSVLPRYPHYYKH